MEHLDEGTIHAWLDGALSPDEGAAVERHAAACAGCAALVAEARGFVAGASRIVAELDGTVVGAEGRDVGAAAAAGASGAPPSFVERAAAARPRPPRRFFGLRNNAIVAAALTFLAIGVFRVSRVATEQDATRVAVSMADTAALAVPAVAVERVPMPTAAPAARAPEAPPSAAPSAPPGAVASSAEPPPPPPAAVAARDSARPVGLAEAPAAVELRGRVAAGAADAAVRAAPRAAPAAPAPPAEEAARRAVAASDARVDSAAMRVESTVGAVGGAAAAAGAAAAGAAAPGFSVSGRVTSSGGAPVAQASVSVDGTPPRGVLTDGDGRYVLGGLAPGTYGLTVRRIGYAPVRDTVRVAADVAANDVALSQTTTQLSEVVVTGVGTESQRREEATKVSARAPASGRVQSRAAPSSAAADGPALAGCYTVVAGGAWVPNEPAGVALPFRFTLEAARAEAAGGAAAARRARNSGNPRAAAGRWSSAGESVVVELPDDGGETVRFALRPDGAGALRGTARVVRGGVAHAREVTARRGCE